MRNSMFEHAEHIRNSLSTAVNLQQQFGNKALLKGIKNKVTGRPLLDGISPVAELKKAFTEKGLSLLKEQQEELSWEEQKSLIRTFPQNPMISVIMPLYNAPVKWLDLAVRSIQRQSYENWELCLVDDGSTDRRALDYIQKHLANDSRLKLYRSEKNEGISAASNRGLAEAAGDYAALVDQDDELPPDAFFWMVKSINEHPDGVLFYSDECKILDRIEPQPQEFYLKPDWSPELMINHMYTGHLSLYKINSVVEIGGFRSRYDYSQDYDLAIRVSESTEKIYHVERILYYWRMLPSSGAGGGKDFARISNISALHDYYLRRGIRSISRAGEYRNYERIVRQTNPLVSIVIPSDSVKMLEQCIKGLVGDETTYCNIEMIVVTNSKTGKEISALYPYLDNLKIVNYDKEFNFSDKCNEGVKNASGDIVVIYNDDVRPFSKDWIESMLDVLMLPGVGGVSPLTLYQDNTIQYSGMITGVPGLVGTSFNGNNFQLVEGPFNHFLIRDVSVLCGACMMMKKDVFLGIGGFDSENTPSGHSDVDISFRIREHGLRCVYTPNAGLFHIGKHGWEVPDRKNQADIYCLKKWLKYLAYDPYFTDSMKKTLYRDIDFDYKIYPPTGPGANLSGRERNILVITHELSLTGAPIALKALIAFLLENGDWPVVVSPIDGPMREVFQDMGVITIIDGSITAAPERFELFARNFDLVVANTLGCAKAVSALSGSLPPVLWWLHESNAAFDQFSNDLPHRLKRNVHVFPVANCVRNRMKERGYRIEKENLPYGLISQKSAGSNEEQEKNIFVLVGGIENRKGQDIFLRAIDALPGEYRDKAQFLFIGAVRDQLIFREIQKAEESGSGIRYIGTVSNREVLEICQTSACVVVPSRDDPLPVVAAEAMELGKPCICSDQTGTADYIQEGVNGLIFKSEDAEALSEKIMWVIDHPKEANMIGENGKALFDSVFSYPSFCERTRRIVERLLSEKQ